MLWATAGRVTAAAFKRVATATGHDLSMYTSQALQRGVPDVSHMRWAAPHKIMQKAFGGPFGYSGAVQMHIRAGLSATRQPMMQVLQSAEQNIFKKSSQYMSTALHGEVYDSVARGLTAGQRQQLAVWLGVCTGWVSTLIILGGVTRLTRSGLSMTDWKFTGERPPVTAEDWALEFAKYQESPEFKLVNSKMTVEQFKFIYWMEYAHRMWGRALGAVFAVPVVYFAARGCIKGPLAGRLTLLFLMGGAQGFVGWWMVRSGLQQPEGQRDVPRVSPYRLAGHLTCAFVIYTTLLWTTLSLANPVATASTAQQKALALLRSRGLPVAALIAITAVSGAFVAGLDAGRAYNTFPLMNGQLIPAEYFNPDTPGWRNAFENTAAVQLHHRALALSTLAAISTFWASTRALPLPPSVRNLQHVLLAAAVGQVTLGITTLLTYVPAELGSLHQAGALALMTVMVGLMHAARAPAVRPAAWATPAAAAAVLAVGGAAIHFA